MLTVCICSRTLMSTSVNINCHILIDNLYRRFFIGFAKKSLKIVFLREIIKQFFKIFCSLNYYSVFTDNYYKRLPLIFSRSFGASTPLIFFLSFCHLSVFYRSVYIFFRGRPRSYVADVFSPFYLQNSIVFESPL